MSGLPENIVAVLGAGSWGTALAMLPARQSACSQVRLWDRSAAQIARIQDEHENAQYLPGVALPDSLLPMSDLAQTLDGATCVVIAVPSGAARAVLTLAAPFLPPACDIVLATKGLEPETGLWPAQVVQEIIGDARAIVALSGPNLAREVALGVPTAAVAACPDGVAAARVRDLFNSETFRVYANDDRIGVEVGGAVKNVLGIAGGICEGMGFGDNTRAFLLTRGLAEMARLGVAVGARRETFYGLAGVGDLMATAASKLSRNFRVGVAIAQGRTLAEALQDVGQTAEGVTTAQALLPLARSLKVEMPVCESVARLLFEGGMPHKEVAALMTRLPKTE